MLHPSIEGSRVIGPNSIVTATELLASDGHRLRGFYWTALGRPGSQC